MYDAYIIYMVSVKTWYVNVSAEEESILEKIFQTSDGQKYPTV